VRYLTAAEQTGNWLLATAERSPRGWSWPVQPGVCAEVIPGLGWGTAGPTMFFVEAFRTTGDERWLSAARAGVRWMDAHLDESAGQWAGCGLLTGIGGWAVVLNELAAAARDEQARELARRMDDILDRAIVDKSGMRWSNREFRSPEPDLPPQTTYLQGAPGIGSTLLRLHRHLAGDPWTVHWPYAPAWTAPGG
jgi:hypothetical protein